MHGDSVNCPKCDSLMNEFADMDSYQNVPAGGRGRVHNILVCPSCGHEQLSDQVIHFNNMSIDEMIANDAADGEFGVGPLFNSGGIQGNNYGLSSERKSKTKKRTTRKKGKRYYSKLKVGQLKKILKEKGLSVGGVKGELVERLTDNSWKKKQQTPWNERKDVRKSKKKRHAISLESKSHEFLWSQYHIILLASTFLIIWIFFGDAIVAIMCTICILILQMLDHAWNEQGRYGER